MQDSKIEWTTHTFNPWRGCTKISAGCANCYAETLSHRNPGTLGVWGPKGTRVVAAEAAWREPLKWDKAAAKAGERHRVFCASLADVFEDWQGPMLRSNGKQIFEGDGDMRSSLSPLMTPTTMNHARQALFELIAATPNLDWLLLTKRPERIIADLESALVLEQGGDPTGKNFFAEHGEEDPKTDSANMLNEWIAGAPPTNVWLGTSVENQQTADERIPHLLKVPAAVWFLSAETLLGPIEFSDASGRSDAVKQLGKRALSGIDWVIVGGESGPGARPCDVLWIRSIVKQCEAAGVACFVKQLGSVIRAGYSEGEEQGWKDVAHCPGGGFVDWHAKDKKGGNIEEFPDDLRVREFPNPSRNLT